MTTREFTIAFEIAIGLFALFLAVRRIARLMNDDKNHTHERTSDKESDE